MSKRDTRRAITGLFAERDEAIAEYAENYLRRRRLLHEADECAARSKELRDKAIASGARPRDLKAAEDMVLQGFALSPDVDVDASPGDAEDHPSGQAFEGGM